MKKVGPRLYVPVLIAATATFSPTSSGQEIDEVIVTARLQSSAQALLNERMEDDAVKDVIGSEMIGRIGDTTVAAALRRVAGLSLVNNKFVYVRGLGERYSSSTLNGAVIPSPDLTRNVIPLDIFPTSIVESLSVQKSYAPEQRASFGGGNIDIRTKGIPDAFTWSIEASGGVNSEVSDLISYNGSGDDDLGSDDGKRALSLTITEAITRFRGTLNANGILNTLLQESQDVTLADAQDLNREIALALNRDISISPVSDDPDFGIKASMGNNFFLDRYWEVGFQIAAGYSAKWRKTETLSRDFGLPDEQFERESETTRSVDLNGNANFGVRFTQDHEITTTHLFVRNTDDETSVTDRWTDNFQYSDYSAGDGRGLRDSKLQFEEREMTVHQIKGEHLLGFDTRDAFPSLPLDMIPEGLTISWQYSEAEASTSIPNEVTVRSSVFVDSPAQVNLNQGA
ncbi:MAG: TonB-dependent receptor plug domain-containing protein, partial [Pseudomonadota bacterium]